MPTPKSALFLMVFKGASAKTSAYVKNKTKMQQILLQREQPEGIGSVCLCAHSRSRANASLDGSSNKPTLSGLDDCLANMRMLEREARDSRLNDDIKVREWLATMDGLCDAFTWMPSMETRPSTTSEPRCPAPHLHSSEENHILEHIALFVCEDCIHGAVCHDCLLEHHALSPLHRIKKWNGECLIPWSLRQEGYIWSLGHRGGRCHLLGDASTPRKMTIVDTSGYHDVNVHFCLCSVLKNASERVYSEHWEQLLAAGLWPATFVNPDTAFHMTVMNNFVTHNNTDKKSSYNYCWSLRMLTNPEDPHSVSVRVL